MKTPDTSVPLIAPIATAPTVADADGARTHHKFSPSTLGNREVCPCWDSRTADNARSIAGTIAHKATETETDDNRLSDDDAVAVAECLDFVENRRQILIRESQQDKDRPEGTPLCWELKEVYLPIDDCTLEDGTLHTTAGFTDHLLLNWRQTYAELIDWKFGYWKVEDADTNPQGISYVLGVFKKFPLVQEVRVWFKQPLLDHMSTAVFKRDQIPALYLRIKTIVERAEKAHRGTGDWDMANPTVPGCLFCANLARCPKVTAIALQVGHKYVPLEVPAEIRPSVPPSPADTTKLLSIAAVLKNWAEAMRSAITDRVLRGDAPVPDGTRIVETTGRRQIVDMARFKEIALKHVGPDIYEKSLSASFGPLEEDISDRAPRGSKKLSVEAFQKALEDSGAVKKGESFSFLKQTGGKT